MRFIRPVLPSLLLLGAGLVGAASSWGFSDAGIAVNSKAGSFKDKLSEKTPLSKPVNIGGTDNLKILLTTTENGKPNRPHQAFLFIKDQDTGLEATFPFSVKENGKAKVELAQKDIPINLQASTQPLQATIVIGSFGTSKPHNSHVFNIQLAQDSQTPLPEYQKPLRYGKRDEIHHIFRADPKSGPKIISIFFTLAILATIPILLGSWASLGANVSHISGAFGAAPISHALFFGSILAMEGIFFLYYASWNLFQTLPAAGVVGLVAFLSGSKALSEVQSRRLAGQR